MSANPARILAASVFMVALNLATVAHATPIDFAGNYTVAANNTDPGLTIETALENNGNLSFSLSQGDTTTIDLFDIWTTESTVNSGDDLAAKDIAVNFLFSLPTIFGETIAGETMGERVLGVIFQNGAVTWDNAADLSFGNGGLIHVSLSNENFNNGFFGLASGARHGATVQATFSLTQAPNPVSEPAALSLVGLGLLGMGLSRRRTHKRLHAHG